MRDGFKWREAGMIGENLRSIPNPKELQLQHAIYKLLYSIRTSIPHVGMR